jgi:peptidyl-prolyl cis-trans isomerase D
MLEQMRKASETVVAKVLMGILMFSFVGWGVASWIFGETSSDDSIIRVGGDSVKIADFETEKNRQIAQMEKAMKKQLYTDKVIGFYFSQQVLSNLASRMLLEKRAEDIGLGVSDQAIASMIKNAPEFQSNGFFSTENFDQVLMANNVSEAKFVDILRRQVLREMILTGVSEGVNAPQFMDDVLYGLKYENRKIDYAAIRFDDYSVSEKPTEDDLKRIYAAAKQMIPEYRTISYVKISANMENPDEYDAAYTKVQKLEDSLISGDTLAEAAKKVSGKVVELEPITIQRKNAKGKEVSDAAIKSEQILNDIFAMQAGEDTPAVELTDGFAIIRVEKVDLARAVPMEEMKDQLTKLWIDEEKQKKAYIKANALLSELNQNPDAGFKASAKKAGTNNYQLNATVTRFMTSIFPEEVLNQSFSAPVGKNLLISGNRAFYVAHVKSAFVPKVDAAKMKSIETEANATLSKMILDDYTGFLGRQYPIKTNEKVFNRLFGEQIEQPQQ